MQKSQIRKKNNRKTKYTMKNENIFNQSQWKYMKNDNLPINICIQNEFIVVENQSSNLFDWSKIYVL